MFESFKKKNTIGIATADELKFSKLAEHVGESLKIYGYFINDGGKYGKSVAVVINPENAVNLPKRYVEIFESLTDAEIDAITAGKVTLANIRSVETKKGDTSEFDLVCEE